MSIFGIPGQGQQKLDYFLEAGTKELRNFIENTLISGNGRELDRITKYYLYWKFYDGQHYRDFNDSMLSFNYVKAFIDKVNQFLLGDSCFSFKVTNYSNDVVDEEVETAVENIMLYNWRKNKYKLLSHEILQMGSICGDAWVGLEWDADEEFAKINLFDSRQCFPIFKDGDTSKLEAFTVRYSLERNSSFYAVSVRKYTADKIITWKQKTTAEVVNEEGMFEKQVYDNALGFIPVVHIKNKPQSNTYFSKSDAHDILKLNKVYNELNQELKSIIDYHATPTTIVTGATIKNMQRGIGNIWSGLPPEANVFNLGLDVDLSAATQFAKDLKVAMHEISDVPENVLGKIQSISGTSAAALKLTYQPLVQQADMKALTYGESITEINEIILLMYEVFAPKNKLFKKVPKNFSDDYRCEPVFAYGFPTDRMIQLQEAEMELRLKLGSRKEIMNRIGKNNVPDLQAQIVEEQESDAELQQRLMPQQSGDAANGGIANGNQA